MKQKSDETIFGDVVQQIEMERQCSKCGHRENWFLEFGSNVWNVIARSTIKRLRGRIDLEFGLDETVKEDGDLYGVNLPATEIIDSFDSEYDGYDPDR